MDGDCDPAVDGRGDGQPFILVGVTADEIDPAWSPRSELGVVPKVLGKEEGCLLGQCWTISHG